MKYFSLLFFLVMSFAPQSVFAAEGDVCTGVYPTTGVSSSGACVTRSSCTGANILANGSCGNSAQVCCKGSVSTVDICTGIYPTTGAATPGACVALSNCTGANILANGSCGNSAQVCCKGGTSAASACASPNSCVSGFACRDGASSAVGICASGSICCQPSNTPNTTATTNPSFNYTLLEKIPGIDGTNLNFAAYLSAVYKLAIWIVGLCALFMFLVGAFMYMLSAANTSKMGSAKEIMQDALIGLVLALTSYLILYVINPDLVNLKLPTTSISPAETRAAPSKTVPSGTYSNSDAVQVLSDNGISVSSSGNCSDQNNKTCTSLEGIPKSTIEAVINLKKGVACPVTVTGGTEVGHTSHGSGLPVVDLAENTCLERYFSQTRPVGYEVTKICADGSSQPASYNCGNFIEAQAHFHIQFKT